MDPLFSQYIPVRAKQTLRSRKGCRDLSGRKEVYKRLNVPSPSRSNFQSKLVKLIEKLPQEL